ncbi:MAG TPA: tetratricopeptide repeat protein [Nitrospirales bacterium]|nr:tetratricopeptide repeat protein [Nitrospirales bacterium]
MKPRRCRMQQLAQWMVTSAIVAFFVACTSTPLPTPLPAPPETLPAAATHNKDGLQLFAEGKIGLASNAFQAALAEDPNMAEAHYNLALTLVSSGSRDEAEHHFIEAANLAPGHKIIWDSPALRPYGSPRLFPKEDAFSDTASEMPNALDNMF